MNMLHKFRDHQVSADTEILILGTFHPDINTGADFFYGRGRNYLWRILPACFNYPDLKKATKQAKLDFMKVHKIDFVDVIASLHNLPPGQEANYRDDFIDQYIKECKDVVGLIKSLPSLKAVYFTRKSFQGIPIIHQQIHCIQQHCLENGIKFGLLETPARFCNQAKIQQWLLTINSTNINFASN